MTTPCLYPARVFGAIICLLPLIFLVGCHANKKTQLPKLVSFDLVAKEKQLTVTQEFEVQSQAVPVAKLEPSSKTRDILVMRFGVQSFHKLENGKTRVKYVDTYEIIPHQGSCELRFQQYVIGEVKPSKSFVLSPTGEITAREDGIQ